VEYLKVKNWEKFQHYKNRNPPWIKLHVKLLNDRQFSLLSRDSKCLLLLLWILASENDGKIPNDLGEIRFRLRDDNITENDINLLIKKQFISNCKQVLADACLETETETETEGKRKRFIPPSFNDVLFYFQEKGYNDDSAKKAFDYYDAHNWHDSRGKKIKNWKQKMIGVWFKPENKVEKYVDAE
jgi:hypothetical protein